MNKPLFIVQILWDINGNTSDACMNFVLGLPETSITLPFTSLIIAL